MMEDVKTGPLLNTNASRFWMMPVCALAREELKSEMTPPLLEK
ncbi:hypothetical protein ACOSZF_19650 [Cytobacillus firmus]|nr:hypothetical protein [Cytobacillus firmus]